MSRSPVTMRKRWSGFGPYRYQRKIHSLDGCKNITRCYERGGISNFRMPGYKKTIQTFATQASESNIVGCRRNHYSREIVLLDLEKHFRITKYDTELPDRSAAGLYDRCSSRFFWQNMQIKSM
ncbi:hypothetical protein J6590_009033 [Homalodisca vitripennis]|nr:hypothetical protein J6590_009033 [Homalodisca vitripennis]